MGTAATPPATLVGQNLGAKRPDRAEQSVWRTGLYNVLFLGSIGIFFILFAEPVVRIFTLDPAVVPLAASCLRIVSCGNIGFAYGMAMLQAFNGAGDNSPRHGSTSSASGSLRSR